MMKEEEKKRGLREQELNGKLYLHLVDMNRYKWSCIMFLGLNSNKIGDECCKMITHIPFPNLIVLGLSYNNLKAKGVIHLSKAEWRNIQQITLNNNDIGIEGLHWLKVAKWQNYQNWNMYISLYFMQKIMQLLNSYEKSCLAHEIQQYVFGIVIDTPTSDQNSMKVGLLCMSGCSQKKYGRICLIIFFVPPLYLQNRLSLCLVSSQGWALSEPVFTSLQLPVYSFFAHPTRQQLFAINFGLASDYFDACRWSIANIDGCYLARLHSEQSNVVHIFDKIRDFLCSFVLDVLMRAIMYGSRAFLSWTGSQHNQLLSLIHQLHQPLLNPFPKLMARDFLSNLIGLDGSIQSHLDCRRMMLDVLHRFFFVFCCDWDRFEGQ